MTRIEQRWRSRECRSGGHTRFLRERQPAWRPASPRTAAVRILSARYPATPAEPEPDPVFDLASFQADAARRAETLLATRRGALVADSVGLGKTYIALAIIQRALRGGERVAVVTPAALRRDWRGPLRRLARESDAVHPATWLSHTRLSRGTYDPARTDGADLVVVDEAHAFRSPGTRRYRALARLCRGARVLLLTATPVNNTVMDLYHLLRLFAGDDAFADVGAPDLREAFRAAEGCRTVNGTGARHAAPLQRVLRAVVIRRTRPFLREHYAGVRSPDGAGVLRFPERDPPVPIRYALDDRDPGFSAETTALVDVLEFAAIRPAESAAGRGRPAGHTELMRLNLLKRLESSVVAFRATVRRQLRFHDAFLTALARGRLLTTTAHRALSGDGDGDAVQLLLQEVALQPLPAHLDADGLRATATADRDRLRRLQRLAAAAVEHDGKLARLRALLDDELEGEKAVIFTEFRETARCLLRALTPRGAVALVDGEGAFLGGAPCGRRAVIARFAPRANGAPDPPPRERVDLLVATDVLAEGLNLQDAARVVNYDLPWNPVRIVQRVGRIDRLGSPHRSVRSYHFLPEPGLDDPLGLLGRLRTKVAAIGRTIGTEGAVLGGGEHAARDFTGFAHRLAAGDPDVLDDIERREAAPFEIEERLRTAYVRARAEMAGAGAAGTHTLPLAAALTVPPETPHRVLVGYALAGESLWVVASPAAGRVSEDRGEAAEMLLRALRTPAAAARPVSRGAVTCALRLARPTVAAQQQLARAPAPLPPHSSGARVAHRLLAALAGVPGGPTAALCRRADALLDALAQRHDAGTEAALGALLRQPPPELGSGAASAWIDALERKLPREGKRPPSGRDERPESPVLLGIIEARPAG